jgi:hypothetical protein
MFSVKQIKDLFLENYVFYVNYILNHPVRAYLAPVLFVIKET